MRIEERGLDERVQEEACNEKILISFGPALFNAVYYCSDRMILVLKLGIRRRTIILPEVHINPIQVSKSKKDLVTASILLLIDIHRNGERLNMGFDSAKDDKRRKHSQLEQFHTHGKFFPPVCIHDIFEDFSCLRL